MKEGLLKKLNRIFGGKMFLLLLFTFIFLMTTVLGNIGDSGYSGIQVQNYFSGSGKQGITQNISFNDIENNSYLLEFEDGLLVNYTQTEPIIPPAVFGGLVAYYKLDEKTGDVIIDEKESYNGINNGSMINQSGKINTSYLTGNGTKGKIENLYSEFEDNFSISAWVNLNSLSTGEVLWLSYEPYYSGLLLTSSKMHAYIHGNNYCYSDVNIGEWNHVVMTYDKSYTRLYINGNETNNAYIPGGTLVANCNVSLGGIDGYIDEVGIWNRTLNSTEVAELYNNGEGLTYSP